MVKKFCASMDHCCTKQKFRKLKQKTEWLSTWFTIRAGTRSGMNGWQKVVWWSLMMTVWRNRKNWSNSTGNNWYFCFCIRINVYLKDYQSYNFNEIRISTKISNKNYVNMVFVTSSLKPKYLRNHWSLKL